MNILLGNGRIIFRKSAGGVGCFLQLAVSVMQVKARADGRCLTSVVQMLVVLMMVERSHIVAHASLSCSLITYVPLCVMLTGNKINQMDCFHALAAHQLTNTEPATQIARVCA